MNSAPDVLTFGPSVLWMVIGILVSIALPVAVKALQKQGRLEGGRDVARPSFGQRLAAAWAKYGGNRYLIVLVAAVFVGCVLVFVLNLQFHSARDAALAGFGWESLVNKLFGQGQGPDSGQNQSQPPKRS